MRRLILLFLILAASSCVDQEAENLEQRNLCEPEFGEVIFYNQEKTF